MVFPLIPMGIEFVLNDFQVRTETLLLTVSLYSILIGVTSRNIAPFGIALIVAVFFGITYGIAVGGDSQLELLKIPAIIAICAVFIMHVGERYNRHVIERTPYPEFLRLRERKE
jgi:hypothetical protein